MHKSIKYYNELEKRQKLNSFLSPGIEIKVILMTRIIFFLRDRIEELFCLENRFFICNDYSFEIISVSLRWSLSPSPQILSSYMVTICLLIYCHLICVRINFKTNQL